MKKTSCFLSLLTAASLLLLLFSQNRLSYAQAQTADINELADKLLHKISQKLQLPIKYKVNLDFKERAELRRYLIELLHKEYPREKLMVMAKAYTKIGLLPKDFPLEKFLIELYSEQVAGFYDPKSKKLFLIKGFDPQFQQMIMVHELVHFLQDQHFNLMLLIKSDTDNDDLILARQAVVEGQATAVMMEILSGQEITQLPDLAPLAEMALNLPDFARSTLVKSPEYIKRGLLFPYIAGTSFIQHYYSALQGYNSLKLFSRLPTSTEQIIHFEKYFDNPDEPTSIKINGLENLLQPEWHPLYSNVIGELDLSILIKEFLTPEAADKGADGWDGSRFYTFERSLDGRVLLIWLSTFDSQMDALEFFQSYKKILAAKYKRERLIKRKAKKFFQWQTEEGIAYLELKGCDVLIIEGIEPEFLSSLIKLCFKATKSSS